MTTPAKTHNGKYSLLSKKEASSMTLDSPELDSGA